MHSCVPVEKFSYSVKVCSDRCLPGSRTLLLGAVDPAGHRPPLTTSSASPSSPDPLCDQTIRPAGAHRSHCGSTRPPRGWSISGSPHPGTFWTQTPLVQGILAALHRQVRTKPPLGVYRTFQVPIADIARTAELNMPDLVDADVLQLAGVARSAAQPSTGPWIELSQYDGVTLTRPDHLRHMTNWAP